MVSQKTKNLIFFIGAIFVAIIFITSYAAFNGTGGVSNQTRSTTIQQQLTHLVIGAANAVVVNYTQNIGISHVNANQVSSINGTLDSMVYNGSVSNYFYSASNYRVLLNSINAYQFYNKIRSIIGNATVTGSAYIKIPNIISSNLQQFRPSKTTCIIPSFRIVPPNTTLLVKINAFVTANGTAIGQMRISLDNNTGGTC